MFRAATVEDVSNSRVTKRHGRIVVVTRYYPRYLKKNLIDEYRSELAPTKALLEEFKTRESEIGDHDRAFEEIDYENKFRLEPEALAVLRELAESARESHVFLVCHCRPGQYCHRELLFLIAERHFGTAIPKLSHPYETFRRRLGEFAPEGS